MLKTTNRLWIAVGGMMALGAVALASPGHPFNADDGGEHVEILAAGDAACDSPGRLCLRALAGSEPWRIHAAADFKRISLAGNALFIIYDAEDRQAVAHHEVMALYQGAIRGGERLAAQLTLSPEDGFRKGHRYLVRVVQLVQGKEVLLAEGDVGL